MNPDGDTIAAVATPPGRGGIGVVRLSGPDALAIGSRLAGRSLRPRHAHHCLLRDRNGDLLDDGLVIAFQGPASFTGEDVVELQGHGGPVVLDRVLRACLELGARVARPGEFSERAFLNDRLDLAQAEAIADLIDSASEAAARGALQTLRGAFSGRIHELMAAVTSLRVYVEAALDFPDEDVDFLADGDVAGRLDELRGQVDEVRREAGRGVLLTDGLSLVLAGAPNAGKSSLLNALARRDTAIVTEVPGTTRDVLRESVELDGIPLRLIDTAGLRDTIDRVEAEGVRRARVEIGSADCLLFLVDAAAGEGLPRTMNEVAERVGAPIPERVVLLHNKIDLTGEPAGVTRGDPTRVAVSLKTGVGLDALVTHLKEIVGYADAGQGQYTARTRHLDALERAGRALGDAAATLEATGAGDLVAEDLRRGHDVLGEIVGAMSADDLLGEIFSSFCIGK